MEEETPELTARPDRADPREAPEAQVNTEHSGRPERTDAEEKMDQKDPGETEAPRGSPAKTDWTDWPERTVWPDPQENPDLLD